MKARLAIAMVLLLSAASMQTARAEGDIRLALQAQRYYVHCINGRVSAEQWDEEQMRVRHGSNVCQLRSFTSASSAQSWGRSNFPSGRCSC